LNINKHKDYSFCNTLISRKINHKKRRLYYDICMNQKINFEPENILVRLKRETEKEHLETESKIPFEHVGFSLNDYRSLLIKFYSFYQSFEPQIEEAIFSQKIDFDYSERLKTPKLSADLHSLGMNEQEISEIPETLDLPVLDSAEKLFGALYVIEGSTLGGQIISRRLREKFAFDQTNGTEFFSGYGSQTGKMWNDYRSAISDFAETSSKHDEIIDAATETFKKIGQVLGEN
jgi:heme oxygenase (biliverdin-IX-beta and delta-forming)